MSDVKTVNGEVVSVGIDVDVSKNGGGSYKGCLLTYRNKDFNNKIEERGFHENTFKFNAALKASLMNLKAGDMFQMNMEKNGQFWNVKTITKGAGSVAAAKSSPAPKSTYETPEERAARQVLIVRQSALSNAVATLKTEKKEPAVEDVLAVAEKYVAWVFEKNVPAAGKGFEDMTDDLPFNEEE